MNREPSRPRRSPRRALAPGLAALVMMAGCGAGDPKPGPEVAGGNAGVDESVSADLKILDVELEFPAGDGTYAAGDDADLYVALSNTGATPDTLLDVTGPDFGDALVDPAGRAGSIGVPGNDTVYVGAEGEPSVTLVDLSRPLRSSQSVPVTFVFERAGSVTVDAVVAPEGQTPGSDVDFPDPAEDPTTEG
jgi:copper(I)-binding protein